MSQHSPLRTQLPSGTVTFAFTDIEGSTRLLAQLGDGYPPVLEEHNRLMRESVEAHDGVVVDTAGDGFFLPLARPGRRWRRWWKSSWRWPRTPGPTTAE